jgi:TP901 family phage tail tape measure protein
MAVNLQLAAAFVDVYVNRAPFNAGLAAVIADLGRLRGLGTIDLRLNKSLADASLNLFQQHLNAARLQANFTATLDRSQATASLNLLMQQMQAARGLAGGRMGGLGAGRGGAGGGGGIGLGGLGMGLLQGLGVAGFATSPGMMAGAMIGGGLKDSVSAAMDLEQTFVGLQRVSGESAANVEKFKRTIFDIGKSQAGVSIKDLTDISMAGAKAGITDKEGLAGLETFTRGMAKVRNSIQGMGTEQLANDMTRMLNLFHKGTDYVESFGSVLARMDNVSTSSAADILDMSKSLSGTFASLNMGIPQVMAFSSVLADVGLTNQQGASSFSQILRMLASQSEKMATLIGVPIDVFQEKVRTDAMGALGMLIARFKEINEVDPLKAQEFLVSLGFRGVKTAGALQQLSSMFEQVQERTKMAIEEESTLGSLLSANALNSTTAIGNIQKLKNAFEELGDAIGSKVVGPMTEMSKVALTMVNGLGKEEGKGGPGGKATSPLSFGEGLEFLGMTMINAMGGAIPNSPEFQEKLNAFKRRLEESFAAGDKTPLETPALTAEERKDANAIGVQEGWANAVKENAPEGTLVGPPRPIGLGLEVPGVGFAREQDRIQAEMFRREREETPAKLGGRGATAFAIKDTEEELAFQRDEVRSARVDANRRGQDEAGQRATRAALAEAIADQAKLEKSLAEMRGARSGREGDALDRKTPEELGRQFARPGGIPEVSEMRKKFMEPGELAEVERRKAMEFIARPESARGEEKARPSQMFSDPADYATHAIQAALSAKDDSPKQTADATKRGAVLLQTLVDAIIPVTKITPGAPGNGMFIFTKP